VNANLIFTWLRDARYAPEQALTVSSPSEKLFLPVQSVADAGPAPAAHVVWNLIEIKLAGGHRLRISDSCGFSLI
jgi:transposase